MRPIEVAPGITVSVKDLGQMDTQFIATHFAAGNAVLTHCSESKAGEPKREYWEIETQFRGDRVRVHYGETATPEHGAWLTLDAALAALMVLGARWMAKAPERAFNRVLQDMGGR